MPDRGDRAGDGLLEDDRSRSDRSRQTSPEGSGDRAGPAPGPARTGLRPPPRHRLDLGEDRQRDGRQPVDGLPLGPAAPANRLADPVPRWARQTIYVGAGAFGALNLTLSSLSIGHLAYEHLHLGVGRSVALALTPDAGALVAGTLWVATTGHLRTWGRSASLGLVAGSVVGNAADILATAGHVASPTLVALAVLMAVAAPVLALVMGHLVLLVQAAPTVTEQPSRAAAEPVTRDVTRDETPAPETPTPQKQLSMTPRAIKMRELRRQRNAAANGAPVLTSSNGQVTS